MSVPETPPIYDEAMAQAIDAAVGSGIAAIDASGLKVHANEAFCRMVGWTREELVGARPPFVYWPEEEVERIQGAFQSALDGRFPATGREIVLKRRNGERFPALLLVAPLLRGGEARGWVANFVDLSAQKTQAEALRATRKKLQATLDAMPDLLFEVGLDGRIHDYHSLRRDLLAAPPEAFLGRRFVEFLPPATVAVLDDAIAEAASLGTSTGRSYPLDLPGGRKWFEISAAAKESSGTDPRFITLIRDITERKEAEQVLRRSRTELEALVLERTRELEQAKDDAEAANRAKTAFLGTVSHELRTPLNAILGFSGLLKDGVLGEIPADQRRPIQVIHRSAQELLDLVSDVMDLSRIEAGRLTVETTAFELRAVLEDARESVLLAAEERALELAPVACDADIVVRADRTRLAQVARNLLVNAIKFTDQGHVKVRAAAYGAKVRVEVEDTGVGIPPDQLHKLFKPFQRVEGQPGPLRPGTGLGLSINRRILQAMGGEIGVASDAGRGSTFWFTVPLA